MLELLAFLIPILFFSVYFLKKLKVPTVISYILVGVLMAYFFPEIKGTEEVEYLKFFYELAVALLFFYIGLEFSFKSIIEGLKNYKLAIIDFFLNFTPILLLSLLFFDLKTSLILALALYPSSTALITRLLVEYKRLINKESFYLINILILEDLVVVFALILLSPLFSNKTLNFNSIFLVLGKLVFVFLIYLLIRKFFLGYLKIIFKEAQTEDYFILFLLGMILFLNVLLKKFGIIEYLGSFLLGSLISEINKGEFTMKYLLSFKEFSLAIFFFMFGLNLNINNFDVSLLLAILIIFMVSVLSKITSTYLAIYSVTKDKISSLRASLSFVPKGEFSIILSSLNSKIQLITLPVVILAIIIGTLLFIFAEKITKKLTDKNQQNN